ncbi:MAG: hypothetical protein A3C93_01545 [Candidatus Lloydbacteria bacterium RIFCSPHIGHO2_02_FULL_54_17]|uniref:Uncharacterized protein n=1 Tax=Candidatus Lloydbacteria bacterium RIFCSPHIGHO2_02_FULL_54_17 TaxID=1798664 RepID=A0A1G2DBU3_9BACT|nr:MAG: hypothetical protein A2762_00475 [Candidatus Lloydbacteria bacterium RIFCSPHIGHO2_01_FULL_54_11]OGZ11013.1 MAG: hypothetical protein A3C93_01545 [Candidatus Lloydbacteria bacterium RIFCSPHIGHO2_02_FULL_54_17]OGZ13164.1 MAG: hypothetical protein A2948_02240 [Candidatus Lloydbacteria bacterium RIFCSPLOWO2_01_FULL_54_18]OGZ15505.1 MAG: hypothetical protein A3H76_00320 [Candidatus Lloydbacteria bacterium RIFCSPLOWO2_02_FULL_54_12]
MGRLLGEQSLVPVTLCACEVLLRRNNNHRLYYFLDVSGPDSPHWLILPQHEVLGHFHPWNDEEKTVIDRWLASDGFRAFMLSNQRSRFRHPVVDLESGKLAIRSGKQKVTPLE